MQIQRLLFVEQVGSDASGVFGLDEAKALVAVGTYQSLIHNTRLLKYVDLEQLRTHEEKLCFYGNLLTLMSIHASLYEMEQTIDGQSTDGDLLDVWMVTSLESVLIQRKVTYWIGQLGLVSYVLTTPFQLSLAVFCNYIIKSTLCAKFVTL